MFRLLPSFLVLLLGYAAYSQELHKIAEINIADYGGSNGILIDNYIFSVDNLGEDRYAVIDISNPSSPQTVLINNFGFHFEPFSMVLDGTTLYIGSGVNPGDDKTLVVMDVSNPEAPVIVSSYLTFPYDGKNFKVTGIRQKVGNYLFCAAGTFNLMTLDVSDPNNIFIVDGFGDGFTGTILSGIDGLEVIDANNAWLDNNDLRHVAIGNDGTFTVGPKQSVTGELYDMQFNQAGTLGFAVSWQSSASNLITLTVSGQTVTESNVLDIDDVSGGFGFGADLLYLEEKNLILLRDVVSFYAFDVTNPLSPQFLKSYTGEGKMFRQGERILVDGGVTADYILYSFDAPTTTELTSDFTATPTTVAPGAEVTFSFSGTGTPTGYSWTFEGGTPATSTAASPVVTYATAGQYKVTLEVTGEGGASATKTKEAFITVEAGGPSNELKASFTASSQNIAPGDKVAFTDSSTGTPTSWSWTFEGGTPATSTLQNPEITYNAVGEYDVQLIVVKGTEKDTTLLANHIKVTEGGSNGGADVTQITELWAKHIAMENNDEIVDIAVDSQGNIYATGFASRTVDDRRVTDVVVTSADKDGNERYYKTVVNNGGWSKPEDEPWTIAVDGNGNAYVAAGLDRYLGGVSGSIAQEHNLISFDAQGTERWRVMTDAKHDYSQYMVVANDKVTLLIDGDAPSGPSTSVAHAISYATATGSEVANSTVDLGQGNIAIGLYVDMYGYFRTERRLIQHNGNIIYGVTHAGTGANGRDIHLRSVSSTGQVLSAKIDSERSFSQDELISLLADQNDNIYVLARLADADHNSIMSLLKFNAQLAQLWRVDVVPDGSSMAVTSMSFDSQGNIVISGAETQPRVAKVSSAGQLLWSKHLKDLDSYSWRAHTVYVSPNDKIILAGSSGVASGSMSFILLDKDGNVTETYKNDYQAEYENFFNKTVYVPSENAVYVGGWARTNGSNDKSLYYGKYAFPLKSSQTITFAALADVPQTTTEVPLTATASSGLAITYSVTGPATLSTNKLLITGPGKVTVTAKQAGNSGYSAAADVSQSFCVIASKPTITASEQSDGVLLTSSAATGNQWYKNGTAITGATEKTYLVVESADYSVRVLVDECEGTLSDVKEVEVSPTLGLPDVSENKHLKVYPNPVSGVFTVESGNKTSISTVDIFSVSGQRVKSVAPMQQVSGKLEVNISELAEGVYLLVISSEGKNYAMRILKE